MEFFINLHERNPALSTFSWITVAGFLLSLLLIRWSDTQILGVNAWIKPAKFLISSAIFTFTMAWLLHYLDTPLTVRWYSWTVILVMAFELIYIIWQAARGELSHFKIDTASSAMMFSLMGVAISMMTLFTAYIGYLFFVGDFPQLSSSYLWGIRLGIIIFVIFAFEGGIMGAKLSHTVGAPDGGQGLYFLNWSVTHGDLRIAHFVGMHALQVLPIAGCYFFRSEYGIWVVAALYAIIAVSVLLIALSGRSVFKLPKVQQQNIAIKEPGSNYSLSNEKKSMVD